MCIYMRFFITIITIIDKHVCLWRLVCRHECICSGSNVINRVCYSVLLLLLLLLRVLYHLQERWSVWWFVQQYNTQGTNKLSQCTSFVYGSHDSWGSKDNDHWLLHGIWHFSLTLLSLLLLCRSVVLLVYITFSAVFLFFLFFFFFFFLLLMLLLLLLCCVLFDIFRCYGTIGCVLPW